MSGYFISSFYTYPRIFLSKSVTSSQQVQALEESLRGFNAPVAPGYSDACICVSEKIILLGSSVNKTSDGGIELGPMASYP
jgi:hypothetical protein